VCRLTARNQHEDSALRIVRATPIWDQVAYAFQFSEPRCIAKNRWYFGGCHTILTIAWRVEIFGTRFTHSSRLRLTTERPLPGDAFTGLLQSATSPNRGGLSGTSTNKPSPLCWKRTSNAGSPSLRGVESVMD